MSSGCPVRLPARVPLPAKALAGMSRGLSPNLRTMFKASLVERFAIRLLRLGFFAAGRLACVPFAGFAACRSSAARRAAGLARRGVVTSLRFAGSWGADSWRADSWAADSWDADSCAVNCWGGKPWSTNSGGLDLRSAGSFAMNSCGTEPWDVRILGLRILGAPWRCAGFPSKAAQLPCRVQTEPRPCRRSRPRVLRSKAGRVVPSSFDRNAARIGACRHWRSNRKSLRERREATRRRRKAGPARRRR